MKKVDQLLDKFDFLFHIVYINFTANPGRSLYGAR